MGSRRAPAGSSAAYFKQIDNSLPRLKINKIFAHTERISAWTNLSVAIKIISICISSSDTHSELIVVITIHAHVSCVYTMHIIIICKCSSTHCTSSI